MSESGIVDTKMFQNDPVKYYLKQKESLGRAKGTIENLEAKFDRLYNYLDDPLEANLKDLLGYYNTVKKETNLSDKAIHGDLILLSALTKMAITAGLKDENPAEHAIKKLKSQLDLNPPSRIRIEMEDMIEFLNWLIHPFERAVFLTFLKTGIRVGELLNIDLCCVHIDHPIYEAILDQQDVTLRPEVSDKPDSLFIYPEFAVGTVVNGEKRMSGNKRKRDDGSVIPIDTELKTALLEYLLIRPYTETSAQPLFVKNNLKGKKNPRYAYGGLNSRLIDGVLAEYGWWEPNSPTDEKVTFHYFRHYFSNNHRELKGVYSKSIPRPTLKYIRGDKPETDDALEEHYTHESWQNWKAHVRDPYLKNVYQFGVYD